MATKKKPAEQPAEAQPALELAPASQVGMDVPAELKAAEPVIVSRRGRPKGSTKKAAEPAIASKRGRPKGSTKNVESQPVVNQSSDTEEKLIFCIKWLLESKRNVDTLFHLIRHQ